MTVVPNIPPAPVGQQMLWDRRRAVSPSLSQIAREHLMPKPNDLSRSPTAFNEESTLLAVIEMGLASWLIAGRIPGVDRSPLRKQEPDPDALLARLHRWRDEAVQAGRWSRELWLRSKLVATGSGLRAGSGCAALRRT